MPPALSDFLEKAARAIRLTCSGTRLVGAHLLEAGLDLLRITAGIWESPAALRANLGRWARAGWQRSWPNDPRYPVTVWAIART